MPGAAKMRVDLVFHKWSCRLIGGQVSGGDSVGEFVNVIAAAIAAGATADEVATFQVGTHPALTASPIAYPLVNAAEMALKQMR
jgi:pyruvate/2-oxoglutarate dehydrogenase complex dihydrolipoamide dehydrogenase (E3) component